MFETINQVFSAVAHKYLSGVDTLTGRSHQHEIGGLPKVGFKKYLGEQKRSFPTTYAWLEDDEDPLIYEGQSIWYDARETNPKRRPEWRLYYDDNDVINHFEPKSFLMVALTKDMHLILIACPQGSQIENQLKIIFNAVNVTTQEKISSIDLDSSKIQLPITTLLLNLTGINIAVTHSVDDVLLQEMNEKFNGSFPATAVFSEFARSKCPDLDLISNPDLALESYMETENKLFKILESQLVMEKLKQGFFSENGDVDVQAFIDFSMSVLQRRKARAGKALENHLGVIFSANKLRFTSQCQTELRKKPDFIFPGKKQYDSPDFPADSLTMLGAKTTTKDRWRQVLNEADRIPHKHLFTLDTNITAPQLEEMKAEKLQLVTTDSIRSFYLSQSISDLWSLSNFIELVSERQARITV